MLNHHSTLFLYLTDIMSYACTISKFSADTVEGNNLSGLAPLIGASVGTILLMVFTLVYVCVAVVIICRVRRRRRKAKEYERKIIIIILH